MPALQRQRRPEQTRPRPRSTFSAFAFEHAVADGRLGWLTAKALLNEDPDQGPVRQEGQARKS